MNTSIFIKLIFLNFTKECKINSNYKYLTYMKEQGWIKNEIKSKEAYNSTPGRRIFIGIPDIYSITTLGREKLFKFQSDKLSRLLAILALAISILSYFKK